MTFSSNPLMAPVFKSPVGDGRDHRPPVVSIKRAEDAVESGIRLHHNQAREGYILQPEVEGLGVAPVELQTAPLASGGSVARHSRLTEGDVFLPITLVSPVPSALPSMFDALVDIARPGQRDEDGLPYQFEVVVFDPYGQETRSRRLIFESGLGDPVRVNHHIWRTSITGRFVDPYWYGQVRELRRTLGSVDKKIITAKQGPPDPDSPPAVTYEWEGEPHASPSVKKVGGEIVAGNLALNPRAENGAFGWNPQDGYATDSITNTGVWGHDSPRMFRTHRDREFNARTRTDRISLSGEGQWLGVSVWTATNRTSTHPTVDSVVEIRFFAPGQSTRYATLSGGYLPYYEGGVIQAATRIPDGYENGEFDFTVMSRRNGGDWSGVYGTEMWHTNAHFAVGLSEQAALEQVETYFDGDTPDVPSRQIGGYEFPFFPVRIGGSVVQGEYELQVEGDAPAYWSGVITPPGEDLLIQNAKGERIFVQGRVDEPILIQTRPQEQDITLADGTPIWDRIDPGDDDFFPLHPGKNTVHVSMVGATQQSEILIRYREAFFHSLGGGR